MTMIHMTSPLRHSHHYRVCSTGNGTTEWSSQLAGRPTQGSEGGNRTRALMSATTFCRKNVRPLLATLIAPTVLPPMFDGSLAQCSA